jgi:hypothetical protein
MYDDNTTNKINQPDTNNLLENYLEQLSDTEKKIIDTATQVLGSSFNITRSIGFIEWKNKL